MKHVRASIEMRANRPGTIGRLLLPLAICLALSLLCGCPESPPVKPPVKAEPEAAERYPEVSARYAEPGEKPRDGSSLVIEIEVPPIPEKLLGPSPPIKRRP
jgi:hypothetical protein